MKPRRLIFKHRFSTGHRAVCKIRNPRTRPRIEWENGQPDPAAILPEYAEWMASVMQTVADTSGLSIAYLLNTPDGIAMRTFKPAGREEDGE